MKVSELQWRSANRADLPQALFGYAETGVLQGWDVHNSVAVGDGIALGFEGESYYNTGFNPPQIIVVDEGRAAEIFSWFRTYAPETFPLSQFARLVSLSDWEWLEESSRHTQDHARHAPLWASVVLGEVLGQGDHETDLASLPFSWMLGCFSTTVARAAMIYSPEFAVNVCTERLQILELDSRFAQRAVSIGSLLAVWRTLQSWPNERRAFLDPREVVHALIMEILRHANRDGSGIHAPTLADLLEESGLTSDSIEERVKAFQRFLVRFDNESLHTAKAPWSDLAVAAAAFLVGRGTSHLFLLQRLAKRWPSSFAWFGLLAGYSGPRCWDNHWSRAAKGAERILRAPSDLLGVTTADLCWLEYVWVAKAFLGGTGIKNLPKIVPRVLSIELIPGAVCQMRVSGEGEVNWEVSRATQDFTERRNAELRRTLDDVIGSAKRAREILEQPPRNASAHQQASFDLDTSPHNDLGRDLAVERRTPIERGRRPRKGSDRP
jgi:hypothetical protein